MADDVSVNPGNGGATVAADDVGGIMHQRVKVQYGSDGSATDVSDTNPLPIDDAGGSLTVDAAGDVAHDSTDGGNPIKVGVKATNVEPAAVANADRVNLIADLAGKLITLPYANPENFLSGTASATGTSDIAVLAAAGAGVRNYVTSIVVHNASSTDAYVTIKDGATAKLVLPAPAKSGATHTLPVALRGTANTAMNFAASAAVTTMHVSMVGYKGA
jgi:hypothetical protein